MSRENTLGLWPHDIFAAMHDPIQAGRLGLGLLQPAPCLFSVHRRRGGEVLLRLLALPRTR